MCRYQNKGGGGEREREREREERERDREGERERGGCLAELISLCDLNRWQSSQIKA